MTTPTKTIAADLTPAHELKALFVKDRNNLFGLKVTKLGLPDEVTRLNGKAGAVQVAIDTVELALEGNPQEADDVFKAVIGFIARELDINEKLTNPENPVYAAGYVDGLKLVLEKTRRERKYI